MKKLNKAGMSMVELIVVVAMLAALLCLLPMSISSVFTMNAKKCADEMDMALSMCKVNAMSRAGDIYVCFRSESDGVYMESYVDDAIQEREKIGNSSVSVTLTDSAAVRYQLKDAPVYLSFNRGNGSCCTIKQARDLSLDDPDENATDPGLYYTSIEVAGADKIYKIVIEWPTGNHYVTAGG